MTQARDDWKGAWEGAERSSTRRRVPKCLRESCEGDCEPAPNTDAPTPPRVTGFQSAADVMTAPRPEEIIEGLAVAGGVTVAGQ